MYQLFLKVPDTHGLCHKISNCDDLLQEQEIQPAAPANMVRQG